MIKQLLLAAFILAVFGGSMANAQEKKGPLYATMKTTLGDIVLVLFEDKAPKTVANFVGLASGTKEWTDPKTGEKVKKPLYNGTIFHRVIQFFITVKATPWLDGRHTVFGEVVKGQEVVNAIVSTPRGANDKPVKDVVLNEVVISRGKY